MNAQIQILFLMIAGRVNRHQQAIIEYLQEENRVLLEQLGGKPKRFTDAQRLRLARKAKSVGRRKLLALGTIVTPDTLLRCSIKTECTDRLIFLGENHLRASLKTYEIHYNRHRNHQGMENQLLMPPVLPLQGRIRCQKQLGGLLNYYYRLAA